MKITVRTWENGYPEELEMDSNDEYFDGVLENHKVKNIDYVEIKEDRNGHILEVRFKNNEVIFYRTVSGTWGDPTRLA